jgi:hypothetical protein
VEWIHWISFDGDQEAEDYLWEREKAQRGVEGLD